MTVFCDNGDCCYIGEDGLCGCDKLSIVGGVCAGSYRSGRNACDGDVDEQLKAENEKLIVKLNAEHIVRQNVEIENARLREELDQWERLTAGIELPEYPITQFHPKDLERDNAKLRELITFYLGCLTKGHVNCDSCAFSGEDNCDHGRKVIESAKQVGIEVNGWRA